jgi:HTH-type transcriptional regulator, competence development regulator
MELGRRSPDDGAVPGPPSPTTFGARLREAREGQGLTQEQVAERSGVHATEVSRIEAGKRDPKVSTLLRLAAALGVPAGSLLE